MLDAKKSTHKVEIVPVKLEKHPQADTLSIIPVFGYSYVAKSAEWESVKRAAWVPPDNVVDTKRPEFSFLAPRAKQDGSFRVKAMRLRGVVSYGLMVPVPDETPLGEDWSDKLDVKHYEPPLEHEKGGGVHMGGETAAPPDLQSVHYDLDAFLRYHYVFNIGEPVVVTEKADGSSSRYVYYDGKIHCGSRNEWKKEFPSYEHLTVENLAQQGVTEEKAKDLIERIRSKPVKKNIWWEILEKTPSLEKFCRDNPGVIVHGELFGNVAKLKYGFADGNRFAAFDLYRNGHWVDYRHAAGWAEKAGLPWVPRLHDSLTIPYDFDVVKALAEGETLTAGARPGTIREGCVLKPMMERYDHKVGRICLKIVNPTYSERFR